ncbi:MAG: hypothetical protein KKA84_11925 [Bacteroidetes bacterium]|nr:hypothetical protein [Bacteroidota bacterium]
MAKYEVTLSETAFKTMTIEANSEDEAKTIALDSEDVCFETYGDMEVDNIEEIKGDD